MFLNPLEHPLLQLGLFRQLLMHMVFFHFNSPFCFYIQIFLSKTNDCTFGKIIHPIKAPTILLIMNEGIKKNAPYEIPMTYLANGTENREEIIPVPMISPTTAHLRF